MVENIFSSAIFIFLGVSILGNFVCVVFIEHTGKKVGRVISSTFHVLHGLKNKLSTQETSFEKEMFNQELQEFDKLWRNDICHF